MLSNILMGLAVGASALIAIGLAYLGLGLGARVVGRGWSRGVQSARRPARRADRPALPAPERGGLCAVGHYLPGGAMACRLGHRLNAYRTMAADSAHFYEAEAVWRLQVDDDKTRQAAGGW